MGRYRGTRVLVLAGLSLLAAAPPSVWSQPTTARKLTQFKLSIQGLHATLDPVAPVVPKGIASGVRIRILGGDTELSWAEATALLGSGLAVQAELSGPSLSQTVSLPLDDEPPSTDPLLLPLPPLTVAGDYSLTNVRLVRDGQVVMDVTPRSAIVRVIDQILVTSVKTRPLTLDEIRQKGIVLGGDDYIGYEFTMGLKLDSKIVNLSFPAVFDRNGVMVPETHFDPVAAVQRQAPEIPLSGGQLGIWVPMLLEEEGGGAAKIPLTMSNGEPVRIPSVLVIPGNVGFLKQFFSAQLYVANGAPVGSGLTVHDISGAIHLPVGDDLVAGVNPNTNKNDDPLALPNLLRDGKVIVQPTTMPIRGLGIDGQPASDDDLNALGPGEQGQAEFLLRGEKEGYHNLTFDIAAVLDGLPVGPVNVKGKASGGVLVRNARFEMNFTVPTVVRRLERFKVYTTLNNIGEGAANDVTVALDTLRMANVKAVGTTSIHIDTIAPGGSKTIAFEFESQRTGAVTAAYLRFDADEETDATGKLNFTVGVSEQGVTLSPDTLALPATLEKLPPALVDAAMHVLGLAWSNANARSLPANVVRIGRDVVVKKALALAEVDLRNRLGQDLLDGLRDLGLDFYGGETVDPGFDQLLRNTRAGQDFAAALGTALSETVQASGTLAYERELAQLAASGPDFLLFAVAGHSGPVGVTVTDDLGRTLANTGPAEIKPAQIDGGVLFPVGSAPGTEYLGLVTRLTASVYRVALATGADWALTFPRGDGTFARAQGESAAPAVLTIDLAQSDAVTVVEETVGGPQTRTVATETIVPAGPQLVTANVIGPEILPGASPFGFSAAFLFDRVVGAESAADTSHYAIPSNQVAGARRQLSGRLVLATLGQPEGPYVSTTLAVSDIADGRGVTTSATVPLTSLLEGAGGVVTGRVLYADGQPVREGEVFYYNVSPGCPDGIPRLPPGALLGAAPINTEGWYELRYVRRHECGVPFTLRTQDPVTTAIREVQGFVRGAGDRLQIDLALVGQGSVTGTVRDLNGVVVSGASVVVTSLVDRGLGRNATTDGSGVYTVHGLTVGAVEVRAAKGIGLGRNSGVIERSGSTKRLDVVLDSGTVTVSGAFFRVEDGVRSAVPGVLVLYAVGGVGGATVGYAWTQADGSYTIDGMPVGPFNVAGRAVRRFGQAFANDVITGFDLVEEINTADLPVFGVVSGQVLYPSGAGPAGDVVVGQDVTDLGSVNGVRNFTITNAEGRFTIGNIPVGKDTGIGAITKDRSRQGGAKVFVDPTTRVATGVVIELSGLGTAVFKVLGPNNSPISGQEVRLLRDITSWGSCKNPCGCTAVTTDANGLARFDRMPMGSVTVKAIRKFAGVTDVVDGSVTLTADGQTAYGELKFAGVGTVTGEIEPPAGVVIAGGDMRLTSRFFKNDGEFVCGLVSETWYFGNIPLNNKYTISGVNVGPVSVTATNPFSNQRVAASDNLRAHGDTLVMPKLKWVDTMGGELNGTVLLPDGVTPAGAGVEVRADGPLPDVTIWTNEDGFFAYPKVLPAGTYTLTIKDPVTGGVVRDTVYLPLGQDVSHSVRLKGRGQVTVVVSLPSGTPAESALVTLQEVDYPARRFEATLGSGQDGRTTFEEIFEGRVSVQVRDGFQRGGTGSGTLATPGDAIEIPVTLTQTGTVKGRFFMPDRTPIPYAAVRLLRNGQPVGQQTTTGGEPVGWFQFDYIPLGHARVELRDPLTGRTGEAEGDLVQEGDHLYLEVTAQSLGTVEGHVWQSHAGASAVVVPNAQVDVFVGPSQARIFSATTFADELGGYRMEGVPEGLVTVTASLRTVGYTRLFPGSSTGTREGEGGGLVLDVSLQDTGIVIGQVFTPGGPPLPGTASVGLSVTSGATSPWSQTTPTSTFAGRDAYFHFDRVPTGQARATADVLASHDRGVSAAFTVPSGTIDVPIVLKGLGYLRVLAQDAAGNPVNGSLIVDVGVGDFTNHFSRPVTGSADFPDVFAGPATVSLQGRPGDFPLYGQKTGQVDAGSSVDAPSVVTVALEPAGSVSGTVNHGNGQPADGAEVTLQPLLPNLQVSRPAAKTWVLPSGAFQFTGVPQGAFKLTVHHPVTQARLVPLSGTLSTPSLSVGVLTLDAEPPQIAVLEPANGSSRAALGGPLSVNVTDAGSGIDPASLRVVYPAGQIQNVPVVSGQGVATFQPSWLVVGLNRILVRVTDKVGLTSEVPVEFTVTGGKVSGHVRRGQPGVPVAGAAVQIDATHSLTTNDVGFFEQGGLRPGSHTVTAQDPDSGLSVSLSGSLSDGGSLTLDPILPEFGTITGVVRNAADTGGVGEVTVTGGGRSVPTLADGSFDLGAFKVGVYPLSATALDGDRGAQTVTIQPGQTVPPAKIVLNGVGAVTVTVTRSNSPVTGAQVSFKSSAPFPNNYSGTTQDGSVTFTGVLAGSFTVKATYQDLLGTSDPVVLAPEGGLTVPVALKDVVPPKVVAVAPANNAIEVGLPDVVRVTYDEPLSTAPAITVRLGAAVVPGQVTLGPADTATFTHPGADFQPNAFYSVTISGAKDLEGNTQASAHATSFKTKDSVPPTLAWVAPPLLNAAPPLHGWVKSARPAIRISLADSGSGVDIATATLSLDGEPVVPMKVASELQYTPPVDLAEGEHVLTASVKDRAANEGTLAVRFGVDATAPGVAQILTPASGQTVRGQAPVSATAADTGSGVSRIDTYVDGASSPAVLLPSPSFAGTLNTVVLSETTHTLTAKAVDRAGNVGPAGAAVAVLVDNQALVVTVPSPVEGQHVHHAVTVRAQVNEDVQRVEFRAPGTPTRTVPGTPGIRVFEAELDLAGVADGVRRSGDGRGGGDQRNGEHGAPRRGGPHAPRRPDGSRIQAEDLGFDNVLVSGIGGAVEALARVSARNAETNAVGRS